jgi:hypothetical protein
MSLNYLYVANDTRLNVTGLQSEGTYLNAATVTWTLYAATDLSTSIATGSMSYTAASNGDYTTVVPSTTTDDLTVNTYYKVKFHCVESSIDGDVWMECLAVRYTP